MFYPQDDVNSPIKDNSILPELEPYTLQTFRNIKIDKVEQQRAYHAQLFKLNCLLDPDQITERPFDIIGHTQVRNANRVITKMQIKYTTPSMVCAYDDNIENVDLEDLQVDPSPFGHSHRVSSSIRLLSDPTPFGHPLEC